MPIFDNDTHGLWPATRRAVTYLGYLDAPGCSQGFRLAETAMYCTGPYREEDTPTTYMRLKARLQNWLLSWQHRLNVEVVRGVETLADEAAFAREVTPGARRPRVAFFVPYDVSENITGGSARAWGICRALGRSCHVRLITVAGCGKRPEHRRIGPDVELLVFPAAGRNAANAASALLDVMRRPDAVPFLPSYLQDCCGDLDAVILDGPYGYPLVKSALPGVPIFYNFNDVTTEFLRKLCGPNPDGGALAEVSRVEAEIAVVCRHAVMVSDADRSALIAQYPVLATKSSLLPNGVDAAACHVFPPQAARRLATAAGLGRRVVLFVGSVLQANIDAMAFMADRLAPALPDELFVVVGATAASFRERSRRTGALPANMVFTGAVHPTIKEAIMALAVVAIAPMAHGTGSSLKIPDYLSHGKAVVASRVAMRGFEDLENRVRLADLDAFPDALRDVLNGLVYDAVADGAARNFADDVRRRFDWVTLCAGLELVIRDVTSLPSGMGGVVA